MLCLLNATLRVMLTDKKKFLRQIEMNFDSFTDNLLYIFHTSFHATVSSSGCENTFRIVCVLRMNCFEIK